MEQKRQIVWAHMMTSDLRVNTYKEYGFIGIPGEDYSNDSYVVVDASTTLQVAKVVSTQEWTPESKLTKYVVCSVDLQKYLEQKERDKRAQQLKKEMDARVKKLQSTAIYETLAGQDDQLREMLSEYKSLLSL